MRLTRAPKRKIRILIADREAVFRLGLKKVFGVEDDLRVVAQAENGMQVLEAAKSFKPDLLFIQAEIAGDGVDNLLAEVRRSRPQCRFIIIGSALTEKDTSRFLKAGASGVILKSADPGAFLKSARKAMENEIWLPKSMGTGAAKSLDGAEDRPVRPADTLTRREKTIITFLMQGCRNREIARHLSITEQTVKNHLRMIYDKVGVSDRLELVLYAIHQRLELPPIQVAETLP